MCAAPVMYCKDVLSRKKTVRAVMANAGQANAATGDQGYQDAVQTASALASALGVAPDDVLLQSTGVIGRRMKMDAFMTAIPEITKTLGSSQADGHRAAVAITTTDLVSKSAALRVNLGGTPVHVGGMCKGSGMIHPNMATMLGVVTCDAAVSAEAWQGMVRRASIASFNQITVDGDTSTNDCVIGLASGASGAPLITDATSPQGQQLEAALTALLQDTPPLARVPLPEVSSLLAPLLLLGVQGLAKAIAWDGEGATCLMEILCVGARTDAEARQVARSVAGSHLAKAAIFGHDPNWGRLAAAAGYSGVPFDQNELGVQLGSQVLMEKGQPLAFDKAAANKYLKDTCGVHGTVNIKVTVGSGPGSGYAWGLLSQCVSQLTAMVVVSRKRSARVVSSLAAALLLFCLAIACVQGRSLSDSPSATSRGLRQLVPRTDTPLLDRQNLGGGLFKGGLLRNLTEGGLLSRGRNRTRLGLLGGAGLAG
ncbi:hypothetical protein QJQ45_004155 [Haematococcus lacustris]|nr:hypothetical protein QJQ45_004155 [Haematococcus lacustris]